MSETALPPTEGVSLWKDGWRRLRKDRLAMICLGIIVLYAVLALAAGLGVGVNKLDAAGNASPGMKKVADAVLFADYDTPNDTARKLPPSLEHPFGTNVHGKDILSRVVNGARIALTLGVAVALGSILLGFTLGAIAGWFGGWVDEVVVWLYSTITTIPGILLMVGIGALLGKGFLSVFVAMAVTFWVGIARLIRAEFMKLKQRDYVLAARALGLSDARIMLSHVAPNVTHLLIIGFSLLFVEAIKAEVVLTFIGAGLTNDPSWGIQIQDAETELMRGLWWQMTFTSAAMVLLVLAFQVFGDALRDALDPRLRQ